MDAHWYIYKDLQIEGPFNWNELTQEVETGRINPDDLIWNCTMREWVEAYLVPGLEHPAWPAAKSLPPQPGEQKLFPFNLHLNQVAIILIVFFLISVGTTSLYLHFTQGNQVTVDELDESFAYDKLFLDNDVNGSINETSGNQEGNPVDPDEITPKNEHAEINHSEQICQTDETTPTVPPSDTQPLRPANENQNDFKNHSQHINESEETIEWLGGLYSGPLQDGKPHGQGTWKHPDGRRYNGDYSEGKMSGYGTMSFPGGERYTGSFLNGKAHGDGTLIHPGGKKYVGEFKHGSIEGYGTITFPGGERYVGYLKNGLGHGRGTMYHPDGRSVSGTWTDGKLTDKD